MSFYWPNFFGKFCSICKAFKWAYLQLRAGIFKAQHQNLWGGKIQTLNCIQIIFFFFNPSGALPLTMRHKFLNFQSAQGHSFTTVSWYKNIDLRIEGAIRISMQLKAAHATICTWQSIPTSPGVLVNTSNILIHILGVCHKWKHRLHSAHRAYTYFTNKRGAYSEIKTLFPKYHVSDDSPDKSWFLSICKS